jgi:predicted nucleotidyltransferase
MLDSKLRSTLATWAQSSPTIKALYVFGSRAKGAARRDSDLDLAFDFVDAVDNDLAELIENASRWKVELSELAGIPVKDVYLGSDEVVGSERVTVFCR